MNSTVSAPGWQKSVFNVLREGGVKQIAYVPDAGHSYAIRSASPTPASRTSC